MSGKSQSTRRVVITVTGFNFTEGVLSALRAYPQVQSVAHSESDVNSTLHLTIGVTDDHIEVEFLKDVILRAGGTVKTIQSESDELSGDY